MFKKFGIIVTNKNVIRKKLRANYIRKMLTNMKIKICKNLNVTWSLTTGRTQTVGGLITGS
jgi:hypothetical protein